ncbi:MAG TPA: hypothetical protein VEA37_05730, partial [Flavobacterium sp.]|nr:hypothetical protein [Flavobacterium sp.]
EIKEVKKLAYAYYSTVGDTNVIEQLAAIHLYEKKGLQNRMSFSATGLSHNVNATFTNRYNEINLFADEFYDIQNEVFNEVIRASKGNLEKFCSLFKSDLTLDHLVEFAKTKIESIDVERFFKPDIAHALKDKLENSLDIQVLIDCFQRQIKNDSQDFIVRFKKLAEASIPAGQLDALAKNGGKALKNAKSVYDNVKSIIDNKEIIVKEFKYLQNQLVKPVWKEKALSDVCQGLLYGRSPIPDLASLIMSRISSLPFDKKSLVELESSVEKMVKAKRNLSDGTSGILTIAQTGAEVLTTFLGKDHKVIKKVDQLTNIGMSAFNITQSVMGGNLLNVIGGLDTIFGGKGIFGGGSN